MFPEDFGRPSAIHFRPHGLLHIRWKAFRPHLIVEMSQDGEPLGDDLPLCIAGDVVHAKPGSANLADSRLHVDPVVVTHGRQMPAAGFNDGQAGAARLQFPVGITQHLAEQVCSGHLEPDEVDRMMGYAHLISLDVADCNLRHVGRQSDSPKEA